MIVSALIAELQKMPPDLEVEFHDYECDCSPGADLDITEVEIRGKKKPRVVLS